MYELKLFHGVSEICPTVPNGPSYVWKIFNSIYPLPFKILPNTNCKGQSYPIQTQNVLLHKLLSKSTIIDVRIIHKKCNSIILKQHIDISIHKLDNICFLMRWHLSFYYQVLSEIRKSIVRIDDTISGWKKRDKFEYKMADERHSVFLSNSQDYLLEYDQNVTVRNWDLNFFVSRYPYSPRCNIVTRF